MLMTRRAFMLSLAAAGVAAGATLPIGWPTAEATPKPPAWYDGYEILEINEADVFSAVEVKWRQRAIGLAIDGLEELPDSGSDRMIALFMDQT